MKAIMYHYVQEVDSKYPFFKFLDFKNFCKQLDFFEEKYDFVQKDDWDKFIEFGIIENSKNKILLTFDDALKCHYDYVFPELKKRNLFGIFYIPTFPYMENDLLDVHKIHLLCGAFTGNEIYELLSYLISEEMVQDKKRQEFSEYTYNTQNNYKNIREIKRILNYYIDYEMRGEIIDILAKKLNYKFFSSSFYLSKRDIREMKQEGNIIGSHGVNHLVMSKLSFEEQLAQIRNSFSLLDSITSNLVKTYCHPYGGFHSFNKDTIKILNAENVKYSFNVQSRDIKEKDYLDSVQFLPRYDCNEFPYGQCSQ
tara:strand:+ start:3804 stop:4733 length:930 start_codon:yes stop_codon:yes gene_type:complete